MCSYWQLIFFSFLFLTNCKESKKIKTIIINDIKNNDSIIINTNYNNFSLLRNEEFHRAFDGDWLGSTYYLFNNTSEEEFISVSVRNGIGNLKEATLLDYVLVMWLLDIYRDKNDSLNSIYSDYFYCETGFDYNMHRLIDIRASMTRDYNTKIESIDRIEPNKLFLYRLRFTSNNKLYNITYTTKNIELIYNNYFEKEFYLILPKY